MKAVIESIGKVGSRARIGVHERASTGHRTMLADSGPSLDPGHLARA